MIGGRKMSFYVKTVEVAMAKGVYYEIPDVATLIT